MQHQHDDALSTAILETVRLPLLTLDADLRVESANDAFLSQFRVTREETVGRLIYDLGNGQWDIPELRRLLGEVLPQRNTVSDYRVAHHFERIGPRIMHVNARRISRSDGPDLILLAISDDTEREGLRSELIGRMELADKLIDSVREGLLILDPDLRVRSASGSFYETFAVEPAETVGRLVYELGNGQWDIPELRQLLEDVLPRQQSFDDYEVVHTFEGIGERVMVLNGRRLDHMDLILLAIRDVTERHESAARLREVAQAAHVGVFEEDRRAGTIYWSPELRDILGLSQDEPPTAAATVPDFIHPDDRPAVAELFEKVLDPRGGGAILHEHRILRPGGEVRWVQMNGRVEFAKVCGEPRPVLIRGVVLDVTERKIAEGALREREDRQAFVLRVSDALRAEPDAQAVAECALRMLSDKLQLDRCYVGIYDLAEDLGVFPHQVGNDRVAPMPGSVRLSDLPRALKLAFDRTLVIEDVAAAEGLSEADKQGFASLGLRSLIAATVRDEGADDPLWTIVAVSACPRRWTRGEIALVEEVTERTWAAIERARAEAALRESEARLSAAQQRQRVAADAAGLGVWEWRVAEDQGIRHDERIHEIFGMSPDAPPMDFQQLVRDFLHPDDREHLEKAIQEGLNTGSFRAVCRITRASDGARRLIEHSGRLEPDADGADRLIGAIADVTERHETAEALRASEGRYQSLFDAIDEGFCITEFRFDGPGGQADYRVVEANPAFYEQTGFPRNILGHWLRKAAPDLEEHWYDIYGGVARTREPRRFEERSDMLGRWFDVYAFPIDDPQHLRVAILFKDITERKRAEERQNMLMAELDHRVKNILAVVGSIARQSLGRGQPVGPEAAGRLVGRISALAQSHSLLAQSRWEGAHFSDLVHGTLAPYRGERAERITVEGPDFKVTPKAAQTLTLGLHELVTNAAKYGALCHEEGHVTAEWQLRGEGADERLVFTWQEQGGPPIEAPPSRKGFGSRLIEQTLAMELGGEVRVEFPREGLRAVMELPLARLRVEEEQGAARLPRGDAFAAGDPAVLKGRAVLLVEDEHLVGQEAAAALESAGCLVVGPVGTLQEALRIAATETLDAAVLDINLAGDLVWPAAHALRARGIPLVFGTGYSETLRAPPELADAFRVEKPVRREQLLSTLAAAVAAEADA